MPRTLSDQLRRSLEDRCQSFAAHVEDILTENTGVSSAFHDALRLVAVYTTAVVGHVTKFWETYVDEFDRLNEIKARLLDLSDKEATVDRIFARSGHSSLPRSLARRIGDELKALQLDPQPRPVLTVGAPGTFEIRLEDWRGFLFHNLWAVDFRRIEEYAEGNFSLITVPYLEGTRAFWEPLVLGHEVGHIKIYYEGHQNVLGVQSNSYLAQVVEEMRLPSDAAVARNWTQELLCDLNMVRLYGPAGVTALGDMLSVSERPSMEISLSHPPRAMRIRTMLQVLDADVPANFQSLLDPWRAVAEEGMADDPVLQVYGQALQEGGIETLWRHVLGWTGTPERYRFRDRRKAVSWLADRLSRGIPGGLVEEAGDRDDLGSAFEPSDVVNAVWWAEAKDPPVDAERLPENTLDRLAIKALDSLDFVRLWQNHRGLSEVEAFTHGTVDEGDGMLSGEEIRARLSARDRNRRLVVTPLLGGVQQNDGSVQGGSIGDAGIDVRLASSFIVFRHSSTAVLDAIRRPQDPRQLQERVEKEWGEAFILHPGELVLAATLEYIVLPLDLVGHIVTRSSWGRLGLITATAVQVQPGSHGVVTLELANLSQTPIALRAGQRIAQLVLYRLAHYSDVATSQTYRYPTLPEFSKIRDDWDNEALFAIREESRVSRNTEDPPFGAEGSEGRPSER